MLFLPSSDGPSWQEDFTDYKDTRNSYTYNGARHGSRSRARTIDDWIKEVERNARLRKKQQGNSYGTYSQGHDESSQGNNSNAQWAGSKYHYSSAQQWDEFKFWKTNEKMEKDYAKFEKDYAKCETRLLGDLDRLYKHLMVVDFCCVWLLCCMLLK